MKERENEREKKKKRKKYERDKDESEIPRRDRKKKKQPKRVRVEGFVAHAPRGRDVCAQFILSGHQTFFFGGCRGPGVRRRGGGGSSSGGSLRGGRNLENKRWKR